MGRTCQSEGDLNVSVLFFHGVGFMDWTQVARIYLPSSLASHLYLLTGEPRPFTLELFLKDAY